MTSSRDLTDLSGKFLGDLELELTHIEEGRYSEEKNFRLHAVLEGERSNPPVATGKYYEGRGNYSPWLEVTHFVNLEFSDGTRTNLREENLESDLLEMFSRLLPPGSHIMVPYTHHQETRRGLEINVPPVATPIGKLLWDAGFTWFKDWYIAEGFSEGDVKLQGNKPPNDSYRKKHVEKRVEELEKYIESEPGDSEIHQNALNRARQILSSMEDSNS